MGKKGFNWRARQPVKTVIDNTKTKQIKLDETFDAKTKCDESNALVLPSKKRKTKIKETKVTVTKLLSKSKRKQLEKIVERRHKKQNRASLLEALSRVQVNAEELQQFTPIKAIQTQGLRKYQLLSNLPETISSKKQTLPLKINSIAGSNKRKYLQVNNGNKKQKLSSEFDDGSEPEEIEEEEPHEQENENEEIEEEEEEPQQSDTEPEEIVEDEPQQPDNKSKDVQVIEKSVVKVETKPAVFVPVDRTPEIQAARLKLPILAEEQVVMETINENQIIIIAGETGSGKTTQVPQFLYEAGYAQKKIIGVTEPRRVAAISMSKRVAEEMNLSADEVSYLIRFEGNAGPKTKIKFMTDGVLLKEMQSDFLLNKYSVIILDEAHERSVYTDILIGFLSRVIPLRHKRNDPLKLIIMSATLRIEDFTNNARLFKKTPPVLKIDPRQFPVAIHFNKRTNENYVNEAYRKVVKLHNQLPAGGILVFLTGQREVNWLVRKLRQTFPNRFRKSKPAKEEPDEDSSDEFDNRKTPRRKKKITLPDINLEEYSLGNNNEDVDSINGSDVEFSDEEYEDDSLLVNKSTQPLWTLPLYSMLPTYKQEKVFEPPPEGSRICIVSTNVSETSLTIPNIKYVVDSGKTKIRLYDKQTGVSTHQVTWCSKAAANQRAGRAGRTGPGHCYRLYSSAVFNDTFKDFAEPEIQRKPVDDLYLQMKCMHIDKIINFPFPSAPDLLQLRTAEARLIQIGALEENRNGSSAAVTPLGRKISKFTVMPRFGKMLALSHQQNLLPYTICIVAALSVPEVLLEVSITAEDEATKQTSKKWQQTRQTWAGTGNSLRLGDPMVLLKAVGAAEYANSLGNLEKFCEENGLRLKAVIEIRKIRLQLTNEINTSIPELDLTVDPKMQPPNDTQARLLRQVLLSGLPDQVAKKIDLTTIKKGLEKNKFKYAYQSPEMEEPVFLHSNSVLRKNPPEWLVYQEVYQTNKMYIRGATAIEPEWLPVYAEKLCNLGLPMTEPIPPRYDPNNGKMYCRVEGTFGKQGWELPCTEIPFPESYGKYRWFAMYLLDGEVFPKLKQFVKHLLNTPSIITKPYWKLQSRTTILINALLAKEANSKTKLQNIWETDRNYLLEAYQSWLPQSAHNSVAVIWPPLDEKD